MFLFFKRIKNRDKWFFFYYTILTSISIGLLLLFRYIYPSKTVYYSIVRTHNFLEFAILTYLFSLYFTKPFAKKLFIYCIVPFCILCIFDYLKAAQPSLAYLPLVFESIFFIILIIYFFYDKIKYHPNEPLFNKFLFWVAAAFFINYSGNFLLFLYSKTVANNENFKSNYNIIYGLVTIIKNILLCIGATIKEPIKNNTNSYDGLIPESNFNDIVNTRNPNTI